MEKLKKIKKYSNIIFLGIFVISMIGCGEKKVVSASGQAEKTKEIVATDQIINADQYDKLVQIGDKVITLPAKLSDFIAAGAKLSSNELSEDYIIDSNSNKLCDMTINNTKFQVYVENNTNKSGALKDTDIRYINNIQGKDIFLDGGIHVGSKLDDLTSKWGEPSFDASKGNDSNMKYCYYDYCINTERLKDLSIDSQEPISGTGNEYTITIDRKTATVTNIQYNWSNVSDTNSLKSYSKDVSFGNQKLKLSFEIPSYLVNDKNNVGICLIDNVPYIIFADDYLQGIGNMDKSINEQNLAETINNKYSSTKYNIEILKKTDNEAYACGYLQNGNSLKCQTVYMTKEHYYKTHKWQITPYDDKGTLTESAISKFKDMVSQFVQSAHEDKE